MNLRNFFRSKNQKTVVFVLGCQRSGTGMLQNIMERNSNFSVYGESTNNEAMYEYRFRSEKTIRGLIKKDRHQFIMFRPLNDSQYADRHLRLNPNTKALWIYRQYADVINSAVKKWGDHQKDIVCWIKNQQYNTSSPKEEKEKIYRIYFERMNPETRSIIETLADPKISREDGAALIWYMRNSIYFDLNLQNDKRVLLVKYEDIVTQPKQHVKRILDFIGCPTRRNYSAGIFSSSIGKNHPPNICPKIEDVCENMSRRLEKEYLKQLPV